MKKTPISISLIDPIECELRKRRIKVNGLVMTVSLENHFWDVLSELASRLGISTDDLAADILIDHHKAHHTYDDRNAVLRSTCLNQIKIRL